jgi:hypothetical protein
MDDNSAPVVGTNTTTGDLCLILESSFATSGITVSLVSGSIYRISGTVTGSGLTTRNFGAVKYTGQSAKGFRVTGCQLEVGSLSTYQPITDFNTEFKAAFPNHSLYVDSNGVAPAVYPGDQVGLVIDSSRGGLENLGAELVTNGGFDSDTWWSKGTGVTITGGVAQYTAATLNNGVFRTSFLTAGKFYVVTFTVSGFSSGGVRVYTGGNRTSTYAANGTYKVFCLAGSSDASIILEATSAGTTLALDNISVKEIPGIHPYQTTSGSRPALCRTPDGGRRNLLTYSEQFDVTSSGWTKAPLTITANSGTGPLNSEVSADTLNMTATPASGLVYQDAAVTSGTTATFSLYVKKGTGDWIEFFFGSTNYVNTVAGWFNISTGAIGSVSNSGTGAGASIAITDAGNGWYRCSLTGACSGVTTYRCGFFISDNDNSTTRLANGTCSIWGAQLETGSTATTYQRVTTTHDVTESGKRDCWGLLADGSDDSLITTSVDFSSTDKMTVMAGVRKNTDATAVVAELTASLTVNAGSFYLVSGQNATDGWWSGSRGTAVSSVNQVTNIATSAIDTGVISSTHDIAGDLTTIRRNSVAGSNATGDKGSGNFSSSIIYLLSRNNGASLRLSGILYTLIIRGAATPEGTIRDFERNLLARRCGVSF